MYICIGESHIQLVELRFNEIMGALLITTNVFILRGNVPIFVFTPFL